MNVLRKIHYAHMEIVVVLIVVKKLGFLVITRDHGSFGGRHQVEILPTDLPELFKPARDLLEPTKTTRTTRTRTTKTTKTPRLFNFERRLYKYSSLGCSNMFSNCFRVHPMMRFLICGTLKYPENVRDISG